MVKRKPNSPEPQSIAVVTDSASDIPEGQIKEYSITVIPFYIHYKQKEFRDGIDITSSQVYTLQKEQKAIFKSSAPSPRDFHQAYLSLLKQYDFIISIHISSRLSGLINSAYLARDLLGADKRIIIYDSLAATMGCGLMALAAARAARQGYRLDQILDVLDYLKANIKLYGTIGTLKYLSLSGRVPALASSISSLLGIKPMLGIRDGTVGMVGISFFRKRSINVILRKVTRHFKKERWVIVSIIHSLCLPEAELVKDKLGSRLNCVQIILTECTPVIGAHTGPGLIGVIISSLDYRLYRLFSR
ncbi:MAG: DegV family protein [Actinomycetia bacterium]|nr:DegV family protein [Actinomycetes bacterium]